MDLLTPNVGREERLEALAQSRVGTHARLERDLEVVAERQVPEVVRERRKPQPLLDEQDRGAVHRLQFGPGDECGLAEDDLLGVTEAKPAVAVHKGAARGDDLVALRRSRIAEDRAREAGREVHRPRAVSEARDAHLREDKVGRR